MPTAPAAPRRSTSASPARSNSPAAQLPAITADVNIDGTSAPGFAGTPAVEIDCNGFGGLVFTASSTGSSLDALAIVDAAINGITVSGDGRVTIEGNNVSVAIDGTTLAANGGNGLEARRLER